MLTICPQSCFCSLKSHPQFTLWIGFITIALLHLIFPATLQAQKGFQFEAWAKPTTCQLLNQTDDDLSAILHERQASFGMSAGAGAGYGLTTRFSIWTGAYYSLQQQDSRFISTLLSGEEQKAQRELRMEYLKIPLRIEFRPVMHERFQIQVAAGAFAAGLLSAAETSNNQRYEPKMPPGVHYSRYPPRSATLQPWHMGLMFQFGAAFKLRYNLWAFANVCLDYSMEDVEDKSVTFERTEAGVTRTIPYYSAEHRPEFGNNRAESRWATGGIQIGLRYHLLPRTRPN